MPYKAEMWANLYRNVAFNTPVGMMDVPGVVSSRFARSRTRTVGSRTRIVGARTRIVGARTIGVRAMGVSVIGVRQLTVWAPVGMWVRITERVSDRIPVRNPVIYLGCYESWLARARLSCRVRRETRRAALLE